MRWLVRPGSFHCSVKGAVQAQLLASVDSARDIWSWLRVRSTLRRSGYRYLLKNRPLHIFLKRLRSRKKCGSRYRILEKCGRCSMSAVLRIANSIRQPDRAMSGHIAFLPPTLPSQVAGHIKTYTASFHLTVNEQDKPIWPPLGDLILVCGSRK